MCVSATPVPEEMDVNQKICPLHGMYATLGFSAKRHHICCVASKDVVGMLNMHE